MEIRERIPWVFGKLERTLDHQYRRCIGQGVTPFLAGLNPTIAEKRNHLGHIGIGPREDSDGDSIASSMQLGDRIGDVQIDIGLIDIGLDGPLGPRVFASRVFTRRVFVR